jgi:hypothetical protein
MTQRLLSQIEVTGLLGDRYRVITAGEIRAAGFFGVRSFNTMAETILNAHTQSQIDRKSLCLMVRSTDFLRHADKEVRTIRGPREMSAIPDLILEDCPDGYKVLKDRHGQFMKLAATEIESDAVFAPVDYLQCIRDVV